ncbi:MAG: hypothetical protein ABDH21_04425 [bacterium]
MESEQTRFLIEYYCVYAITLTYVIVVIYYLINKIVRGKNIFISVNLSVSQYQMVLNFIALILMLLTIFIIIPTFSKHLQNKIEKKYSYSINQKIFKNGLKAENLEIEKYIPSNSDFFKSFLQNQNLSINKVRIVEENSLIINYHKSKRKYKIYLSEIRILERTGSFYSKTRYYRQMFSGLCIGVPNEVFNTTKIYKFPLYKYYTTSDYSIVLVYLSESPFIFPLFEKITDELIQNKLQEILRFVNNYLM